MDIKHVSNGVMAEMFTDMETRRDYLVAPCPRYGWEHLYKVSDISDCKTMRNIDGATHEEALRNYIEHGVGSICIIGMLHYKGATIDLITRPDCDTQYKVRGVPGVYTVEEGRAPFEWRVFEDGADDGTPVEASSSMDAVLEYIASKKREGLK